MFSTKNQLAQAARTQAEFQLAMASALAGKTLDGMRQIGDLHLNVARVALQQANFVVRQFALAHDAGQVVSLTAAQIEPSARWTMDYGYCLTRIASETQEEAIGIVGGLTATANRKLIRLFA